MPRKYYTHVNTFSIFTFLLRLHKKIEMKSRTAFQYFLPYKKPGDLDDISFENSMLLYPKLM